MAFMGRQGKRLLIGLGGFVGPIAEPISGTELAIRFRMRRMRCQDRAKFSHRLVITFKLKVLHAPLKMGICYLNNRQTETSIQKNKR